ncbi:hypothetical protein CANCADRAFT_54417 [Tortispora caseinolytica NRRL Y-17796]|uniref:type I protein arginine methyltransferase n=1 Tax=Tortispora caseinolytica NRRL Y-17796 TaxID=767744 RepID=A0A1E4TD31_9ASCO|nr:hypothetical protein CANCADRAFT_54417 [Tortispora caseinolytica NRRL Y-17796]
MSDSELSELEELTAQDNELEFDSTGSDDYALLPICLFCEQRGSSSEDIWNHCKEVHSFDFAQFTKIHELDFYDKTRFINYMRSNSANDPDNVIAFKGKDEYLKPALEDDALLFEIVDESEDDPAGDLKEVGINETNASSAKDNDSYYFNSYSHTEIHETMIKDSVRTDGYRDFIYENKDLFKNKVVLDVGCGTGILSMFCAKAGARKVYAVDNSQIIDQARAIVYENNLSEVINCIHGKIEDIDIGEQVDIIVSEWMGYGLLYEAMLDSVLVARDRFLKPDGILAPAETRLVITAVEDPEYLGDKINFWKDVYGFKMSAMEPKRYDEPLVESFPSSSVIASQCIFKSLNLYKVTHKDLQQFVSQFQLDIIKDGILDGLVIYFDTYFTRSREYDLPIDALAQNWPPKGTPMGKLGNAFTTGPFGQPTHWKSCAFVLPPPLRQAALKKGDKIQGSIIFSKNDLNPRELDISIEASSTDKKATQAYHLK